MLQIDLKMPNFKLAYMLCGLIPTVLGMTVRCAAHELSYYINATGDNWVCMYTSINIVSLCISF